MVALVSAVLFYRSRRPDTRRPGEVMEEITEKLSRDLPPEAPVPVFTDVTEEAGLAGFESYRGSRTSQLPEDMGSGLAWGDFDDDGDDDLFLVAAGGELDLAMEERAASQLYENVGGGRFTPAAGFPELRVQGMGAAWGDSDGDGRLDLVVTGLDALFLFHNEGDGTFTVDARLPSRPGYWSGAAWGDYDNDRDLDLYVSGYVKYELDPGAGRAATEQYGASVPYTLNPASFDPLPNLLFENDGRGGFEEISLLAGVSNPGGRSLSALWHDFDQDGWLDLYVANDISDNALFLNRDGLFEDAGLSAWVSDYRGAMGLAAGDWNRDGDDDLFITHWIAQENALFDSRLRQLQEVAEEGASVQLGFTDLAAPLGLGQPALHSVGWGTEFFDFDADGWLDLVVANGSTLEQGESGGLEPQPAMLFWSQRGEYFHDLAPFVPALAEPKVARGLALSDYDSDGDLDLAIMHLGEGVRLLRNDTEHGHWIGFRLRHVVGDSLQGLGDASRVTVVHGGVEQSRSVGGASYLSQSSRTLHFGLGEATRVDRVEVRWPGGGPTQVYSGLDADVLWQLHEGDAQPRRLTVATPKVSFEQPTVEVPISERERIAQFWVTQRAAMDALKRDRDVERAAVLLRQALELNPEHEDSRYYLANCLEALGNTEEALSQLDRLRTSNPSSHRGHKQWGVLRALHASSDTDLEDAEEALERALEINTEATGSLEVLGEIALLLGREDDARQRLEWVTQANVQASTAYFLRGYLAWKGGDSELSRELLSRAHEARGEAWKPEGTVAEGDVAQQMHDTRTPLRRFWNEWDGSADPAIAYDALDVFLRQRG